ncbi:MAG: ferric iron uptake transcriptional regulator [Thiofilum sp.]|uniref:ferric iron uptake transcriptional regulator n=1 Tax=Thiofilum sp. TaxID=2212733 RepID=UPI0025EB3B58|nr:ferric iron uptake transcriptional regulator [Thiofilum sp.]MBK8451778.1 ferric iron uptake transcriptional regulator [Thiofilum sp.]
MEEKDIKRAGLKITQPRLKILELLSTAPDRHMSAEEIYRRLLSNDEDIGLATVYRVLTQFEAAGLITRHHFEGTQAVFEISSEDHHDHMVCSKTGRVVEFFDEVIEQRQQAIAAAHGFKISGHSLILYGEFTQKADES